MTVSVLSDEPCWGQFSQAQEGTGGHAGFSALRRAVLGSIKVQADPWQIKALFQCSPTSRVGVNIWNTLNELDTVPFQCSPTSRVGVNEARTTKRPMRTWFQCSPTSRVGVNNAAMSTAAGVLPFQCSPTSRVGVNSSFRRSSNSSAVVSVLSDEPCWGQYPARRRRGCAERRFSALRRAVLGSMQNIASASGAWDLFQCSPTSRVGVNPRWTMQRPGTSAFQCSRTSRVGVNRRSTRAQ